MTTCFSQKNFKFHKMCLMKKNLYRLLIYHNDVVNDRKLVDLYESHLYALINCNHSQFWSKKEKNIYEAEVEIIELTFDFT